MTAQPQLVNNFFVAKFGFVSRVASPYLSIALVVSTLLTLSDVDLLTSLRTSLVIVSISTTGLIAWLLLMREDRKILFPEAIGMGLAIGFILCAGFQLVLRRYGFNIFGGLIPVIIAHFLLLFVKVRKLINYRRLSFSVSETAAVLFTIFFGLYLNAPLILIPAAIFAYVAFDSKASINKKFGRWSTQISCLSIWLTIVLGFILIALTTTVAAPYIFGNSSESIPREAWSNSIIMWGPNENIPLFGNPLRYHWFSFAVFGLITHLSGLAPMVLFNSGLAGVLDCLCVGSIVWSLTYYLSKNRRTALLSVVILYGTVSLNQPYAILADSSPDATSWLVWVVAFGFALTIHTKSSLKFAPLVFSLIGVAAILSNGPHGAVLLVGISGWLIGRWLQNEKAFNQNLIPDLKIVATAAAAMLLAYYLFLTPSDYSTSLITISFSNLGTWLGSLSVLTLIFGRLVVLPITRRVTNMPLAYFFYGLALGALPAFFVYKVVGLANYFVYPVLVLIPIPVAVVLHSNWTDKRFSDTYRRLLAASFLCLGLFLQVIFSLVNWRHEVRLNALKISEYFMVVPPIFLVISAFFYSSKLRIKFIDSFKLIFIISTVFCSLGVGLGYSVRTNVRDLVDMRLGRDYGGPANPTTSYLFRDAMLWLQHSSNRNDLVATNFVAGEKVEDFFTYGSFPSSNLAISAISRRRVLVEGDSNGNVGLYSKTAVPPNWLRERIMMSHQFASRPNLKSAKYMKTMRINWFVVDKSKQMPTTWEPYASIAFENSEVIILKLN